jgi:ubiquinone/menaquinone biosynthesis C-methylase UbiE
VSTSPDDETRATYEVIAADYAARQRGLRWEGGWLQALLDVLVERAPRDGRIVDLGCGPGVHVEYLREHGVSAFGLDRSLGMLGQALVRSPAMTGALLAARFEQLPLGRASVSGVWSSFALLHVSPDDRPTAMAEIARILVDGGYAQLTFAGGADAYREEVTYRPGTFRTFYPVAPETVAELAEAVGLDVVEQGFDPDGHRLAHHALLHRGTRSG